MADCYFTRGKWFVQSRFWLFPVSDVWLRKFEALSRKARSVRQFENEIDSLSYNAQPEWSLRELRPGSLDEACGIIEEFLGLANVASEAFDWGHSPPLPKMKWMTHGWKHISMADLERIAGDVRSGIYPFPDLSPPIDLLQTGEEARELFLRAAQRDPSAVTRLNVLFPLKQTQREVAEFYSPGPGHLMKSKVWSPGFLRPRSWLPNTLGSPYES